MFVSPLTSPSMKMRGREKGEGGERGGGNFKSALSPLFMVGLGWGKGQICLSPPQLPPNRK